MPAVAALTGNRKASGVSANALYIVARAGMHYRGLTTTKQVIDLSVTSILQVPLHVINNQACSQSNWSCLVTSMVQVGVTGAEVSGSSQEQLQFIR